METAEATQTGDGRTYNLALIVKNNGKEKNNLPFTNSSRQITPGRKQEYQNAVGYIIDNKKKLTLNTKQGAFSG
jgi:hypothetical protein